MSLGLLSPLRKACTHVQTSTNACACLPQGSVPHSPTITIDLRMLFSSPLLQKI